MMEQLKAHITNEETYNTIEDIEITKENNFDVSKESFFKISKSSPVNNPEISYNISNGADTQNNVWTKHREPLFTEEDIMNNDVYHRLFKDSKIKSIKETEFVEFLKIKRSNQLSQMLFHNLS